MEQQTERMEEKKKLISNFELMAKANAKKKMRLIIAGSRTIQDYGIVAQLIRNYLAIYVPINLVIIQGEAKGVDKLAKAFAIDNDIKWKSYPANWGKHGKSAGPKRNRKMAKKATHLLAIWDGESRGTNDMVKAGKEYNLHIRLITYKISDL